MPSSVLYPGCFDLLLRYAIDTDFAYFRLSGLDGAPPEYPLSMAVELHAGLTRADLIERVGQMHLAPEAIEVGPADDPLPFLSVRCTRAVVSEPAWMALWNEVARAVALSMPLRPALSGMAIRQRGMARRPGCTTPALVAVIDDGCAFAHWRLKAGAGPGSRVLALWDQNFRAPAAIVGPNGQPLRFGHAPTDFDYGVEFWRAGQSAPNAGGVREAGIDEWVQLHRTASGIDEDGCYARAGFDSLRRRASHGTHVLDLMAGAVPPSQRVEAQGAGALAPPGFAPADDDATRADIVFVQLPRWAIDDPTGDWLLMQVQDAMRYILSCAGVAQRIVVNISYGPTTRPHDGQGQEERMLAALCALCAGPPVPGWPVRAPLSVTLPAGNARQSDWHVRHPPPGPSVSRSAQWTWRVPPDNPVPVFAEFHAAAQDAGAVTGALVAPVPAPYTGPQPLLYAQAGPDGARWLAVIPPTRAQPDPSTGGTGGLPVAPHGDWTLRLDFSHPGVVLDAYIARSGPNMGSRVLCKPSRFIDPAACAAGGGAAALRPVPGGTQPAGSLVCGSGSLSGMATGAGTPGPLVAGGYQLHSGHGSPYASVGPSRGARQGPDWALPTDQNAALWGMPGAGTRAGGGFRLVGTSTAAPQLGRLLARQGLPAACAPGQQSPALGCGALPPP